MLFFQLFDFVQHRLHGGASGEVPDGEIHAVALLLHPPSDRFVRDRLDVRVILRRRGPDENGVNLCAFTIRRGWTRKSSRRWRA